MGIALAATATFGEDRTSQEYYLYIKEHYLNVEIVIEKVMPKKPATSRDLIDQLIADWRRERLELDAAAMGVVGRILHLGRQLEARAAKALRPFGLHYTDLDVLATLRRSGVPYELTPSELLSAVLITSGAMTSCLDRLEAAGLVRREISNQDRRVRRIRLTSRGRALVDKAIVARFEDAADSIRALTTRERGILAHLLRKLGANINLPREVSRSRP